MNDDMLDILNSLSIGNDFTIEGVLRAVDENKEIKIFGGLTRDQFVEKALFVPDLAALPVGHLGDHRVRMTRRLLSVYSWKSRAGIEQLLWNLLCRLSHPQARQIVAQALHLNVTEIADKLVKIREYDADLFRLVIGGYLGKAIVHLRAPTFSKAQRQLAASCIADILLIYCMFEVQLLAARAKAQDNHLLGRTAKHSPVIASEIVHLQTDFVKASEYYRFKSTTGRFPRGKPPSLAGPELVRQALRVISESGRSIADIQNDLAASAPMLAATTANAQAALNKLELRKKAANTDKSDIVIGGREHASTMLEGVGAGIQLAFATLRLINLRDQRGAIIKGQFGARKLGFRPWCSAPLPSKTDKDAEAILFIVRVTVLRDEKVGRPFYSNGEPACLVSLMKSFWDEGTSAGQDLFKSAKANWPNKEYQGRAIVTDEFEISELAGVQRVDILPDYRLQLKAASPPAKLTAKPVKRGMSRKPPLPINSSIGHEAIPLSRDVADDLACFWAVVIGSFQQLPAYRRARLIGHLKESVPSAVNYSAWNRQPSHPASNILRLAEVLKRTGLRRSTLYAKIADGTFPAQVRLSANCVGWHEHLVDEWCANPR